MIRGYAVHEMLKREGFVDNRHLQLAKDQEQNLRKLFSGKTDLLVGSELDGDGVCVAPSRHWPF